MKNRFIDLLIFLVIGLAAIPVNAATKKWNGTIFLIRPPLWSNPDNWEPRGVPVNGDDIVFDRGQDPFSTDTGDTTINDIENLTIRELIFLERRNFSLQFAWTLQGNLLRVTRSINAWAANNDMDLYLECPIRLESNVTMGTDATHGEYAGFHIHGPIDLNGHTLTLREKSGGDVDLESAISGIGDVIINGSIEFTGNRDNTFQGRMLVQDPHTSDGGPGQLILNRSATAVVPGEVVIDPGCQLKLSRSHQIADTATVTVRPGGEFLLQGHTESIGALTLGDTTTIVLLAARVDTGGSTLSVSGDIRALSHADQSTPPIIQGILGLPPGNHEIYCSTALYIYARTIGDGWFTKTGDRELYLLGDNSFTGDVIHRMGRILIYHANALGAQNGIVYLEGGALELVQVTVGNKFLFANGEYPFSISGALRGSQLAGLGAAGWGGPIILNTNLNVFGDNLTLSGPISGPGGLLLGGLNSGSSDPLVVRISGAAANTYTGPTLAHVPVLELNKLNGARAFSGSLEIGSLTEVRWLQDWQCISADVTLYPGGVANLNNHRDEFGAVTFNGGSIQTGTGEIGVYGLVTVNPSVETAFVAGRLGLPAGFHNYQVADGAAFPDLRIDAQIVGPGHLRKTGPGQMWLMGDNTYEGITTVAEGALSVTHPNGLGSPVVATTVQDGGLLELNFLGTMPEPIAIRGASYTGQGSLGIFGDVTLRTPLPGIFAAIDLTASATIGVARESRLVVDGIISGVGNLTKAGLGALDLAGSDPNTYSGETFINEGSVLMRKPNAVAAIPGPVSVGSEAGLPAVLSQESSFQVINNIFVNRNGLYNVNDQVENVDHLWLLEGGDVRTGTGVLSIKPGGSIRALPGTTANESRIVGKLEFDTGTHAIIVQPITRLAGGPELTIDAVIAGPAEAITLQKSGLGRMVLSANNTYRGTTIVSEGVVQVDGNQPSSDVTVMGGATLTGVGHVGSIRLQGGTVEPGNGPGVLLCNGFNSGGGSGILRIELNGNTAGTSYDQLNMPVILGEVVLNPSTFNGVTLQATLGFNSSVNDQFTIINKAGTGRIPGACNGLPEGATFSISSERFSITYTGGNGNDVVLTRVASPPRPSLSIARALPNNVRLTWATNAAAGYRLQYTTNLSVSPWFDSPSPATQAGTNLIVTEPAASTRKYYRLFKP